MGFVPRQSELSGMDYDLVAAAALSAEREAPARDGRGGLLNASTMTGARLCALLGRLSPFLQGAPGMPTAVAHTQVTCPRTGQLVPVVPEAATEAQRQPLCSLVCGRPLG